MQDKLIAHQILVQRFGSKVARDFLPFIKNMRKDLLKLIAEDGTANTKKRLNAQLKQSKQLIADLMSEYDAGVQADLFDFIDEEIVFNSSAFGTIEHEVPSVEQVITAATNTPMVLNNQSVNLAAAQKALSADAVRKVNSAITAGFTQGQTTQQITSNIVDITGQIRRNAETLARTTTNFLANETRDAVYKQNEDIVEGYTIVATLDFKTSDICKGFDGEAFLYTDNYNPMPPFHYNCRSTTKPKLKDQFQFLQAGSTRASKGAEGGAQVPATQTYYTWLKAQPAAMQDEALGKTKGLIFRNAGLSPQEFKDSATDRLNQPLTIDEMKRKSSEIDQYLSKAA